MTKPEKVAFFACTLLILIHAVSSFFPKERLWGLNQLAYVSFIPRWIIIILAFLILVPKINQVFYRVLAGFFNLVDRNFKRINRYHKYVFFSLVSIMLFWVFKAKAHLLGDGTLRGNEIATGTKFSITEPLDFYLHALVYRLLKLDPYLTYTLISCLAGALFIFLALWFSNLLGKENKEKVFAFVVLISMGSVQLFFGYVESYTLVYAGIMAYFLFSLWFLEGKCSLIFPSLALFLSISFHLSALYLLPSLIYLGIAKSRKEEKTFDFKSVFSITFILLLVGAGLFILNSQNPDKTSPATYFISLFGSQKDPYSLFSGAHLVDMINEQLLLSPVGIILWAVVIFSARKIDLKNKVVIFFMIVTLFSFLFAFIMDPKLGYARDWDLFSSTGLGYTLLGIYLVFDYFRQAKIKKLNYMIMAVTFTALFCTLPWIYVNAQEDKAVERFKALLNLDVKRSGYGHVILADYYRDRSLINEEMEEWKKALAVVENERYLVQVGICYWKLGRHQEAIATFKKAIQLNPNSAMSYDNLGVALSSMGEYEEAKKQYQMSIKVDPYYFRAYTNLGALFVEMGNYEEALKVLKSAIQINPDYFEAYDNLAIVYNRMGKPKEVVPFFQAYLKRNKKDYQRVQELLKKMNIDLD
jgi:tetratricopeptide (TPR) repeat protein